MSEALQTNTVTAAMIADAIAADPHSRSKTPFIKLSSGTTVIRILPPFDPENHNPYRVKVGNRYTSPEGYFRQSMELKFVVEDEYLLGRALAEDKITKEDVEMVIQYGDPFSRLYSVAKDMEWEGSPDDKDGEKMWAKMHDKRLRDLSVRKGYLWNAVARDEGGELVSVWESSSNLRGKVIALLGTYPELFDPEVGFDIQVIGNGKEGLARRYDTVIPMRDASPVGFDYASQLHNLDDMNVRNIDGYAERLRILFQQYGALVEETGLTLADFGAE